MLCTPPAFILSQDQTLEKIISYLSSLSYNLFSSYSFLASFTLLSIYNSFDEICTLLFALYLSLVVQFSMTVCRLFRDSFVIIPHLLPFVNTFFKTFLSFFRGFLKLCSWSISLSPRGDLNILPLSPLFVNTFLQSFLDLVFCPKSTNTDFGFVQVAHTFPLLHISSALRVYLSWKTYI